MSNAELAELAGRLAALEQRVEMQEGLRASQDRDLASIDSTLRAQHHTLQALAITQSEHNFKIDQLDGRLERVEGKIDGLRDGMTEIITMLNTLIARGENTEIAHGENTES